MRQIYEYHPTIGFRFIPELKARIPHEGGGYLVRTNTTGFRCDHAFEPKKPAATRRVLLFGDSFTAGEGVSNGKRWGDYLEGLVPNLEVYNYGLPATGTDQHYLIYKEYARGIEHDLLIIAVFVENIRRVAARYRHFMNDNGELVLYAKPYFTLDQAGKLKLRGVPPPKHAVDEESLPAEERAHIFTRSRFPKLKGALDAMRDNPTFNKMSSGLLEQFKRITHYQPISEYDDPKYPAWLVMREVIREWIANHPKPALLIPVPLHHYVEGVADPSNYQARLREAAEAGGGSYVDPLEKLSKYPKEKRDTFYFAQDHHLTPEGNQAFAASLAPAIADLLGRTEQQPRMSRP